MRRTFKVVDVTEILIHWYAGRPKAEVARSLGVDDKTVRKYVAPAEAAGIVAGGPPMTEADWRALVREWFPALVDTALRQPTWNHIALHHEAIAGLLGVVPVSVIHQRLADEAGLEASVASMRRYVRAHFGEAVLRAAVAIPRPEVAAGSEAQVDYGYMGLWFDPADGRRHRVWAFSMVLSHSRHVFVWPLIVMDQAAWVEAHVRAFDFFGGSPARLIPDNLAAGVTKADLYDPQINRAYAELGAHYGVLIDPARAARPKDKPRIEAIQRYIRSSFFAGREWPSLAAMRADAVRWCRQVAGGRAVRALEGRSPLEVFASAEAPALLPLPIVPFELARWSAPKVGPDAHAKVGKTLYSVPWRYIGTRVDARATGALVQFYLQGELIKTHPFQAKGRRTDWADLPPERTAFFLRTPTWCRIQSCMVGPATEELVAELLSVNALFRLRQAQGVLRFGVRYGDERLEAACRRAIGAGDPSYKTVKGILAAGTEHDALQQRLEVIEVPAWLRGPDGFAAGGSEALGDDLDELAEGDAGEGQR